jgi:hypothetical protein
MSEPRLKVVIVHGSVRPGNYTAMASAVVADELGKDPDVSPAAEKLIRRVATGLIDYIRKSVCPRVQLEQILREGTT